MRAVFFLVLLLLLSHEAYAYYFIYSPPQRVFKHTTEYEIDFAYKLNGITENEFKVRPILPDGVILIYNRLTDSWVFSTQLWEDLPPLAPSVTIKFLSSHNRNAPLYFEVLNTLTGELYTTQTQQIWFYSVYMGYLTKLYEGLSAKIE